jgi:hypothetical protein
MFCVLTTRVSQYPTSLRAETPIYRGTWAHLKDVLHKSISPVCVSPCRFWQRYTGNEYTHSNRIVVLVVFYEIRIVSRESRRIVLPRTPCFTEQGRQPCVQPPTWRTRSLCLRSTLLQLYISLVRTELYQASVACDFLTSTHSNHDVSSVTRPSL